MLLTGTLNAQVEVSVRLDSTEIYVGDPMTITIEVSDLPNLTLQEMDWSVWDTVGYVERLTETAWEASSNENILAKYITITSFDTGYHILPPLLVEFEENGTPKQQLTSDLAFTVKLLPAMEQVELAPIKDIEEEGLKLEDLVLLLAAVLLIGLIILLVRYFNRKKTAPVEVVAPPAVVLPAHEVALQQLRSLKAKQLWQKGEIKPYYTELTRIVRVYLEQRYRINALEMTTAQILEQLRKMNFEPSWKSRLTQMLQSADLIKFAKGQAAEAFHQEVMKNAEAFVEHTKQLDPQESESAQE